MGLGGAINHGMGLGAHSHSMGLGATEFWKSWWVLGAIAGTGLGLLWYMKEHGSPFKRSHSMAGAGLAHRRRRRFGRRFR
jgi:hypothetical protein